MNWKRFMSCMAIVFVAQAVVAGTLFALVVNPLFEKQAFFRAQGQERFLPYLASRILFVGLFTYIFARTCRRSGWTEGLRYGILIWLFYSIPMTIGFWAFITMPDGLAVAWIAVGLAEYAVSGSLLGLLYRSGGPDAAMHLEPAPN